MVSSHFLSYVLVQQMKWFKCFRRMILGRLSTLPLENIRVSSVETKPTIRSFFFPTELKQYDCPLKA